MWTTLCRPRPTSATEPPHAVAPYRAYAHVAAVIGLALFASGTPSPLYGTYRELWGFSPVVLTLVYATYAFGVLASLLLAGRLSDEVGRRPVLLAALAHADGRDRCCSCSPTRWSGCSSPAASRGSPPASRSAPPAPRCSTCIPRRDPAARRPDQRRRQRRRDGPRRARLGDARPARARPARPPLRRAARAVRDRVRRRAAACPSRSRRSGRPRLTPQRPSVPPRVRRPFLLAALARDLVVVGRRPVPLARPAARRRACSTPSNHLVTGLGVFALAGSGAAAQLVFGRTAPWAGTAVGSLALATGMLRSSLAASTESTALFWLGAIIGGAGFGVAFLGGLRALSARSRRSTAPR